MAKMNDRKERSGSALGFEAELWAAADKMRGHMDPRTTNTSASASSSSNTTFLNGLALQKFPANGDESLPVIKIAQLRAGNSDGADRASYNVPGEYVIEDGDVLFSWSGSLEVGGCLHLFEPKLGPECRSVRRI